MNPPRHTALILALLAATAAPAAAQGIAVGKKAPEITAEHWMNLPKGMSSLSLKQLKGKVVMIAFWETGSAPCRKAIPFLTRTNKQFKKRGVVLLALTGEPDWKVTPFVVKNHIGYIVASDAEKTVKKYGISNYPTILILDPDGEIKWKGSSTLMADEVLKQVLRESPPKPGGILEETAAKADYKQAERYLKKSKYAKAYKAFRKVSKRYKSTKYGKKAKKKLKEIKADEQIMAAINAGSLHKDCLSWLDTASVLLKRGETKKAARYYRRIIKKYPDSDYAQQAKKKLEALAKKD